MNSKIESPCIECPNMINCKKMCYKRLEWAVFEADKDDEEFNIYGNNIKVEGATRIKPILENKYKDQDEIVQALLREFDNIYNIEVVKFINRESL